MILVSEGAAVAAVEREESTLKDASIGGKGDKSARVGDMAGVGWGGERDVWVTSR